MPEQFVNPSPNYRITDFLFFDFPCEGDPPVDPNSTYRAPFPCSPNVNLRPPAIEEIYGPLGSPPREQGHPFMREFPGVETEDPSIAGLVGGVDQVVDIDRGIRADHTGRLSGGFVRFIATVPYFSEAEVSAVAVAPHTAATASIDLGTLSRWLTPGAPGPNTWFWRILPSGQRSNELLFTRDVVINPLSQAFEAETVYKLVYQWRFWRFTGSVAPIDPPQNPETDRNCERMPMSGFDESIAFEVISPTVAP